MRRLLVLTVLTLAGCGNGDPYMADKLYRMSRALNQSAQPTYYAPPMQPMFYPQPSTDTDCYATGNGFRCTSY